MIAASKKNIGIPLDPTQLLLGVETKQVWGKGCNTTDVLFYDTTITNVNCFTQIVFI